MPKIRNTQDGDKKPYIVSLNGQPSYRTDAGSAIEAASSIIEAVLTPDGAYVSGHVEKDLLDMRINGSYRINVRLEDADLFREAPA